MRKIQVAVIFLFVLFATVSSGYTASRDGEFSGSGAVISVDPVYARVTITHPAIKGLSGDGTTEFFATSADVLRNVETGDTVDFKITQKRGEALVTSIARTGRVEEVDDVPAINRAFQGALETTGEVAKTITQPIPPAHGVVSAAAGATTDTTGALIDESKQKF